MSEIWFTSDTHYGHKNICRGTSEWESREGEQKVRDFDTIEEMNNKLVSCINEKVKADDILYHLGDWSFGGEHNIRAFRERINCKNIHLIFGNHDQHIENYKKVNHLLFSSTGYYKEISVKGNKICLFHFCQKIWNKMHHGAIHLYGHSHGTLPDQNNRSMDVGVDTNNYYPYHIDEILRLKEREVSIIDHHNSKTN